MPEQARAALVGALRSQTAPTPAMQANQHAIVPFSGSVSTPIESMGSAFQGMHVAPAVPAPVSEPPVQVNYAQLPSSSSVTYNGAQSSSTDYSQLLINAAMTGNAPSPPPSAQSSTNPLANIHPGNVSRMLSDQSTRAPVDPRNPPDPSNAPDKFYTE